MSEYAGKTHRERWLLGAVRTCGPPLLGLLATSQRWHIELTDAAAEVVDSQPVIYTLWHDQLLPLVIARRDRSIRVLISRNRDGQHITDVIRRFGYEAIRGSSSRGGMAALKALVRCLRDTGSVGITPDGPRGPRHVVQDGVIYVAAVSGAPLIPISASATRGWRMRSWDRFLVPKPFARVSVHLGDPIWIPSGAKRDPAPWRDVVRDALDATSRRADAAIGGRGA
jgi:lysophospholipid acyltransferase (LPLAT)-like uncharacterized protein